jgi:DNA polymerase-3 subunit beta
MQLRAGDLAAALARAGAIVPKNPRVAILGDVLVEPHAGSGVSLMSSDLDRDVATICLGEGEPLASSGTVPLQALRGLADKFPPATALDMTFAERILVVSAGRARYKLPVLPSEDFPEQLKMGNIAADFALNVARYFDPLVHAAATDAARSYLNGIFVHVDAGGALTTVATDGHRLVRVTGNGRPPADGWHGAIIPLDTVAAALKIAGRKAEARLRCSTNIAEITLDGAVLTSKLIDGTFPDYARVLPSPADNFIVLERRILVDAAKRLIAVADQTKDIGKLGGLTWSSDTSGVALCLARQVDRAEDSIPTTEQGGAMRVAVSLHYLIDLLEALPGSAIRFDTATARAPIRATVIGDDAVLAVLMPAQWREC